MSNFVELVKLASSAKDKNTRNQNEARLLEYIKGQPLKFLEDCITNFKDTNIEVDTRQMIGLVLKKTLVSDNGGKKFWEGLENNVKSKIKDICLGQLIDKDLKIKKASGAVSFLIQYQFV